jgi:hypothetical protein
MASGNIDPTTGSLFGAALFFLPAAWQLSDFRCSATVPTAAKKRVRSVAVHPRLSDLQLFFGQFQRAHQHARTACTMPVGCKSQPMDRTGATGRGICFPGWTGALQASHPDPTTPYLLAPNLHRMGERQSRRLVATPGGFAVQVNATGVYFSGRTGAHFRFPSPVRQP